MSKQKFQSAFDKSLVNLDKNLNRKLLVSSLFESDNMKLGIKPLPGNLNDNLSSLQDKKNTHSQINNFSKNISPNNFGALAKTKPSNAGNFDFKKYFKKSNKLGLTINPKTDFEVSIGAEGLDFGITPNNATNNDTVNEDPNEAFSWKKPTNISWFSWSDFLSKKVVVFSWGFLFLSLIFFTFSGYKVYSDTKPNVEQNLATCNKILSEAKNEGLDLNFNCGLSSPALFWQNLNESQSKLDLVETARKKARTDALENLRQKNIQISDLINRLANLGVDYKDTGKSNNQQNTQDAVLKSLQAEKEAKIKDLETKITQAIKNLDTQIEFLKFLKNLSSVELTYNLSVKNRSIKTQNNRLDLTEYNKEIDYFIRLTQTERESKAKEIQKFISKLQTRIEDLTGSEFWTDLSSFRYFSNQDFNDLWEKSITDSSPDINQTMSALEMVIFEKNPEIDTKIYEIAQKRGFKKRSLTRPNLVTLDKDFQSQPGIPAAFEALKKEAKSKGINIVLTSAYRDPVFQKQIFTDKFNSILKKYSLDNKDLALISSSDLEKVINETLSLVAPPGYSRHHTGFTLDFGDITTKDSGKNFGKGPAYQWLSANNYLVAKKYGFIPSYPGYKETESEKINFGPEPEPWEYVYVGVEKLKYE